jgi:hypothetical protein
MGGWRADAVTPLTVKGQRPVSPFQSSQPVVLAHEADDSAFKLLE